MSGRRAGPVTDLQAFPGVCKPYVATWLQAAAMNCPMAPLWTLFVAGPLARAIVKRIPVRDAHAAQHASCTTT